MNEQESENFELLPKEPKFPEIWASLNSFSLQMTNYSTWVIRTTALVLIIALAVMNETEEVQRIKVAVVLHAVACVVSTLIVFWNNQETMQTFKQSCESWFMTFLFLSETLPSSKNNKAYSKDEIRGSLWLLESKLKETYMRLNVCFFTNIPLTLLQSYFLFDSQARIYEEGLHWIDMVRLVFITTTIFDAALTVTTYERYTHDHTVQLYQLDTAIRPNAEITEPENFRFWRIFLYQMLMITQWVYTSTFFLAISCYHVAIYMLSMFLSNYMILKLIPEFEKSYVNAPHGVHTVSSFWTMRIINIISSVGTRLNQCPIYAVDGLGRRSFCLAVLLLLQQIHFVVFIYMYFDISFDLSRSSGAQKCGVLVFMVIFLSSDLYELIVHEIENGFKLEPAELENYYPLLTGYAFYKVLFEHVCVHLRGSLVPLRTVMITSLAVYYSDFYKHYQGLRKNRELPVKDLIDQLIFQLELVDTDPDKLMQEIGEIRNKKLKESFPFVHEFDEFMSAILQNGNEEEKINDLKLFHGFYDDFDDIIEDLTSDKIQKIFEVMKVPVRKDDDGILENQDWVFL